MRPAARAAAVKLPFRSIAGRETAAAPSAFRRKVTWLSSSSAISRAYCAIARLWKSTLWPPVTPPLVPLPPVRSGGQSPAVVGVPVELGLQVLQVEGEVQDGT